MRQSQKIVLLRFLAELAFPCPFIYYWRANPQKVSDQNVLEKSMDEKKHAHVGQCLARFISPRGYRKTGQTMIKPHWYLVKFFVEIDVNLANKRDYIITINIPRQHLFWQRSPDCKQLANLLQFCKNKEVAKTKKQRLHTNNISF